MKPSMNWMAVWGAAACLLSGCATTDFDAPRTASHAFPPSVETRIGANTAPYVEAHAGKSGFYLLADGLEALAVRLLLAQRAERSIDVQYYFMLRDVTTNAFIAQLLAAADRGVRVRLLLDDIQTKGYDFGLAALESHPSFEIRIFNPFSRRRGRELDFLTDFGRVNRRMHNKSFTVDSQATVVGGRNIGAEYFAGRDDVNFGDLDVLAFGPVAVEVGAEFDAYWNSELAVPISAVLGDPELETADLPEGRKRLAAAMDEIKTTAYAAAVRSAVLDTIRMDPEILEWADSEVVYDPPEKALTDRSEDVEFLRIPLKRAIDAARSELLVISPYFVPLESGVEGFRRLRERGVEVTILTNSLAATDVPAVHAGYAPYRRDLLEMGVRLFEMRPDIATQGARRRGMAFSQASLHAKGFAIDRRELFVGSFNWDPRSVGINTEMGILIDSPALAERVVNQVLAALPAQAYEVVLDEKGRLRWLGHEDGEVVMLDKEPHAGFWLRFTTGFLKLLPIRGQL